MNNIEKIELFAKENYVPIARKETIEYIKKVFKENNYKSFLEIGTAIGYTSINVALLDPSIRILTLEYEEKRFNIAKENIKDFNLGNQIQQVYGDARFFYPDLYYDVIFIDAAKKRNKYFLDKFSIFMLPLASLSSVFNLMVLPSEPRNTVAEFVVNETPFLL